MSSGDQTEAGIPACASGITQSDKPELKPNPVFVVVSKKRARRGIYGFFHLKDVTKAIKCLEENSSNGAVMIRTIVYTQPSDFLDM